MEEDNNKQFVLTIDLSNVYNTLHKIITHLRIDYVTRLSYPYLLQILITTSILTILWIYIRYQVVKKKFGIHFGSIGWMGIWNLANSQSDFLADRFIKYGELEKMEDRPLFKIEHAYISFLNRRFSSLIHVNVCGVDILDKISIGGGTANNRKPLARNAKRQIKKEKLSKVLRKVVRLFKLFGIVYETDFDLIWLILYPLTSVIRYFCVKILSRLISVEIDGIRVRLIDVEKNLEIFCECESVTLKPDIVIVSALPPSSTVKGFQAMLRSIIKSPKKTFRQFMSLQPSDRSLDVKFVMEKLTLSGRILDFNEGENQSPFTRLIEITQNFSVDLRMRLSRYSYHLMAPNLSFSAEGLCLFADAMHKVRKYFKSTQKEEFYSPVTETIFDKSLMEVSDPTLIKLLNQQIRDRLACLMFCTWKVQVKLKNTRIEYDLDSEQCMRYSQESNQVYKKDVKKYSIISDQEVPGVSMHIQNFAVGIESARSKKRDVEDMPSGALNLQVKVRKISVYTRKYFAEEEEEALSLEKFDCKFSVAFSLASQLLYDDVNLALSENRLCFVDADIANIFIRLDLDYLYLMLRSLTGEHVNQETFKVNLKQIVADKELSLKPHTITVKYLLSKYAINAKLKLDHTNVIMLSTEGDSVDITLGLFEYETHWDRYQKPNSGRRPSLNEKNEQLQLYFSTSIALQTLSVQLCNSKFKLLDLPQLNLVINSTIPGRMLTMATSGVTGIRVEDLISVEFVLKSSDFVFCSHPLSGLTPSLVGNLSRSMRKLSQESGTKKTSNDTSLLRNELQFMVVESVHVELGNFVLILGSDSYGDRAACVSIEQIKLDYTNVNMHNLVDATGKVEIKEIQYTIVTDLKDINQHRQTVSRTSGISLTQECAMVQTQEMVGLYLEVGKISGVYGIYPHLIMWRCIKYLQNCIYNVKHKAMDEKSQLALKDIKARKPLPLIVLKVKLEGFDLALLLPNNVKIQLDIVDILMDSVLPDNQVLLAISSIKVLTDLRRDLISLSELQVSTRIRHPIGQNPEILVTIDSFLFTLPNGYNFSALIDNIANFVKTLKQLVTSGTTTCPEVPGRTADNFLKRSEFQLLPSVTVQIANVDVCLEDSELDSNLCRNYLLGADEQRKRLDRIQAMESKIKSLKEECENKSLSEDEVELKKRILGRLEEAWLMLDRANGRLWIQLIRDWNRKQRDEYKCFGFSRSPLFQMSTKNVRMFIQAPKLTKPTLAETINDLDNQMPVDTEYDLMLAAQIQVKLMGIQIKVRDFERPMLNVFDGSQTEISGLIILCEQVKDWIQQSRRVQLAICDLDQSRELIDTCSVYRTIIPVKMFTQLQVTINQNVEFTYGVSFEPHLADLNRIFSSLTPTSVDPSEPLPFWDKLRLILHGNVRVLIPDNYVRIRLSGSRKAHDSGEGESAGMEVELTDGIDIKINHLEDAVDEGEEEEEDKPEYDKPPIEINCGEVLLSVPFDKSRHDQFARLSGGVQLGIRLDFETTINNASHEQVFTKSPAYATGTKYDSFSPIRSKSIVVNVFVNAPIPNSLTPFKAKNYLQLSQTLINHFIRFNQVYTSPLTVLPIKRGQIHYPPPQRPPKTQKLSRFIQGVNFQAHLKNLLAGYMHPTEDYKVGLRARIEEISLALSIEQENFIPGRRGAKWEICAADFDMTQLEIRTVCQNFIKDDIDGADDVPGDSRLFQGDVEDESNDLNEWKFEFNKLGTDDEEEEEEILEAMLWAPKMIYFRHGSDTLFEIVDPLTGEIKIAERDVNLMQTRLLQRRLEEIDEEIERDKETIKMWEERIQIYYDDQLVKQSKAMVEKMELMYEKKQAINKHLERRIRQLRAKANVEASRKSHPHLRNLSVLQGHKRPMGSISSHLQPISHSRKPSMLSIKSNQNNQVKRADYLHRFVIHNLSVLWNLSIRNVVFKFIDLEQNQSSTQYFIKHQAFRILKEMLNKSSQQNSANNSNSNNNDQNSKNNVINEGIAKELLDQLLNDQQQKVVVTDDTLEDDPTTTNGSSNSRDPTDPAYISPEYSIYHDVMVQCFYPQVSFQTTGKTGYDGSIIVSAESANVKTLSIMDEHGESQLVKRRRIIHLDNAQFHTVFKSDLFQKLGRLGLVAAIEEIPWPVWVPVENLIDSQLPAEEFQKFVHNCQVVVQIDNCSPTYLQSEEQRRRRQLANSIHALLDGGQELEHVNSVYVRFPRLAISASSAAYCALYDVIGNLLVYSDPLRKQRQEQVGTMLFSLAKENLGDVLDLVQQIQDRIRSLEFILQANINAWQKKQNKVDNNDFLDKQSELKRKADQLSVELLLLMEALKRLANQRQSQQQSNKKSHRTIIKADEVRWKLLTKSNSSNEQALCELTLRGANYYTLSHEDRSNMHTIEVDKLTMINQLPKPYYTDLISPYLPDGRQLDFNRHKMLRVYWRELAPVAGISIIDHFEINIFPLLLQLTFDIAKGLIEYFYPKKKVDVVRTNNSSLPKRPRSVTLASQASSTALTRTSNRTRANSIESLASHASTTYSVDESSSIATNKHKTSSTSKRAMIKSMIPLPVGRNRALSSIDFSEDSDAKLMKDRASSNKTFVYIKVPGSTHCLSYHGEKDKNIEDLYQFVLRLPTLEYHNRTWSWLEFVMAVRKDIALAVFGQTGSLVREKLAIKTKRRKRPPKADGGKEGDDDDEDDDDDDSGDENNDEKEKESNGKVRLTLLDKR